MPSNNPKWVTVVGALGIIFGLAGLIGAAQVASMPKVIEMQKAMFKAIPTDAAGNPPPREMQEFFESFWGTPPPWFQPAAIVLGLVALIVNGLYIFAAIALLQLKPFAVKLFGAVLITSMILALVRSAVLAISFSMFGMTFAVGGLVGLVMDGVLLAVLLTSDKSAMQPPQPMNRLDVVQ